MSLPSIFFGTPAAAASTVLAELVPGQHTAAGLLLPANPQPAALATITDGTSNTIMVGELMPAADCLREPWPMKPGFGLLLPRGTALPLAAGQVLASMLVLPPGSPGSRVPGAKALGVRVKGIGTVNAGTTLWLVPQGIIAVLIGL